MESVNARIREGLSALDRGDYEAAFKELKPLAKQGLAEAQYNLGLMYDTGYGVPQDYEEALKWYKKAAEQGDENAREARSVAEYQMTSEQIAEAQRLSREFKVKKP